MGEYRNETNDTNANKYTPEIQKKHLVDGEATQHKYWVVRVSPGGSLVQVLTVGTSANPWV